MVRPAKFAFNPQTAATNSFQSPNTTDVNQVAQIEFDCVVDQLRKAGIHIDVVQDNPEAPLPDSIFPNNWFSTHPSGVLMLYPMLTENRRAERKEEIIDLLRSTHKYNSVIDLSFHEKETRFLEGTGSIVFDHVTGIAYACISPRTDREVLLEVCDTLSYIPFVFVASDRNNQPIYHTNVMMAIGPAIAVCCFDAIHDENDRQGLWTLLSKSGKTVVPISVPQMESFAGNMLFISNGANNFVAVSSTAWDSLSENQKSIISSHATPIVAKIPTIEKHGGGSIRCMLAELF
jgi:hypothetical protein